MCPIRDLRNAKYAMHLHLLKNIFFSCLFLDYFYLFPSNVRVGLPFKPTALAILSVNERVVSPSETLLVMVNRPDRGVGFSKVITTFGFSVKTIVGLPGHIERTASFALGSSVKR